MFDFFLISFYVNDISSMIYHISQKYDIKEKLLILFFKEKERIASYILIMSLFILKLQEYKS